MRRRAKGRQSLSAATQATTFAAFVSFASFDPFYSLSAPTQVQPFSPRRK
jgi:hypothetical protein